MENQTPFDLNQQIQAWRDNLGQSPAVQSENLNELEAHLRDSVATLQTKGLSSEEAFIVAAKRIGTDGLLAAEFGKINNQSVWLDRMLWMLVGVQLWGAVHGVVGGIANAASNVTIISWLNDGLPYGQLIVTLGLTLLELMALGGSLAVCWWLVMRQGPQFGSWLGRFLQRRFLWIMSCGLLADFLIGYLLPKGFQMLYLKSPYPAAAHHVTGTTHSLSMANLLIWICRSTVLLALTIILARKSLKQPRLGRRSYE